MEAPEDWEETGFVGIFRSVSSFTSHVYSLHFPTHILTPHERKVKISLLIILNRNS